MFAFPSRRSQFYEPSHYSRPTRRQQQYASDPFGRIFGGRSPFGGYGYGYDDEEDRMLAEKQRQAEVERQRQLRAQQMKRRQEQEAARKKALAKYTKAATTIQRAFRSYRQAKLQETQDDAARTVTRYIRMRAETRVPRLLLNSLRQLKELESDLNRLISDFKTSPRGYRHLLYVVDSIEKLILKTDEVLHYRHEFVRLQRKGLVNQAQEALRYCDVVLKTMHRHASVIGRRWRQVVHLKTSQELNHSARIVTKAVGNAPAISKAKRTARALRLTRAQLNRVQEMKQQYLQLLAESRQLVDELAGEDVEASTTLMDMTQDLVHVTEAHTSALTSQPQTLPPSSDATLISPAAKAAEPSTATSASPSKKHKKKRSKRKHKRSKPSNTQ